MVQPQKYFLAKKNELAKPHLSLRIVKLHSQEQVLLPFFFFEDDS